MVETTKLNETQIHLLKMFQFIKDEKQLTFHQIAVLLKRDDRTIWTTYQKAKNKLK